MSCIICCMILIIRKLSTVVIFEICAVLGYFDSYLFINLMRFCFCLLFFLSVRVSSFKQPSWYFIYNNPPPPKKKLISLFLFLQVAEFNRYTDYVTPTEKQLINMELILHILLVHYHCFSNDFEVKLNLMHEILSKP